MTEEKTYTYPYEIGGRLIALKTPSGSQVAAALKIVDAARKEIRIQEALEEKDRDGRRIFELVSRILRFIDILIVSEEDRQFVEDAMIEGTVDLSDLTELMSAFAPQEEAPKNGPVKKAARARRAS